MQIQATLLLLTTALALGATTHSARATTVVAQGLRIVIDHNDVSRANPDFYFSDLPRPSSTDAATSAAFTILDGEADAASAGLDALHDGKLPTGFDQPSRNFFFERGTDGGLLRIDLKRAIPVQAVITYSCHPSTRGPQVYTLYASDGRSPHFNASPYRGDPLDRCGWQRLASVRTAATGDSGGQWAVSIAGSNHLLGRFRYLLFDIHRTESDDPFGNTFFSEIDVIAQDSPTAHRRPETIQDLKADGGKYSILIDTTAAPELTDWARRVLGPAARKWYPKIVQMLPSKGFTAPAQCCIEFRSMGPVKAVAGQEVAVTVGNNIYCGEEWFRQNLRGEALGCVIHEMTHVVQQYSSGPNGGASGGQPPSWLVEGIADYIRWFLFEPQSHGAEITRANFNSAHYNASYRITANFLNWVVGSYGKEVIVKLNAAARQGAYDSALWKKLTGHNLTELDRAWRQALEKKLGAPAHAGG